MLAQGAAEFHLHAQRFARIGRHDDDESAACIDILFDDMCPRLADVSPLVDPDGKTFALQYLSQSVGIAAVQVAVSDEDVRHGNVLRAACKYKKYIRFAAHANNERRKLSRRAKNYFAASSRIALMPAAIPP